MGFLSFARGFSIAVALILFSQPLASFASTCAGADPAIVSVVVKGMQPDGGINHYTLSGKVSNLGSLGQGSSTLQFVDIYRGETKIDSRGVPPLRAGESYTFEYVSSRSAQAGDQTTALGFRMRAADSSSANSQSCSAGNGITMIRF
jgi:hypothetical protein